MVKDPPWLARDDGGRPTGMRAATDESERSHGRAATRRSDTTCSHGQFRCSADTAFVGCRTHVTIRMWEWTGLGWHGRSHDAWRRALAAGEGAPGGSSSTMVQPPIGQRLSPAVLPQSGPDIRVLARTGDRTHARGVAD